MNKSFLLASLALASAFVSLPPTYAADDAPVALAADVAAKARAMRIAGKSDEAVALLENDAAVKAGSKPAKALLGLALLDLERQREADDLSRAMDSILVKNVDVQLMLGELKLARCNLGRVSINRSDLNHASSHFKLAAAQDKSSVEAQFGVACCEALITLAPPAVDAVMAFESRQAEMPKGLYARYAGPIATRVAQDRIEHAISDDATIALLRKAIAASPKDPQPVVALAKVLVERDQLDEADKLIATIEKNFDQRMEDALWLRAAALEKQGKLEDALKKAADAVVLSGRKNAFALLIAARVAMKLERYDDARRPLDELMKTNNASSAFDAEAQYWMATYQLVRARQSQDPQAVGDFLKQAEKAAMTSINLFKTDLKTYELLAQIYELWGKPKEKDLAVTREQIAVMKKRTGS